MQQQNIALKKRFNKRRRLLHQPTGQLGFYSSKLEPKVEAMLNQQLNFNQIEVEYRGYLKKGFTAIKNLGHLFDNAGINGKRNIVRSSLRKNLVLSDGKTQTEKPNKLLSLISLIDLQHKGSKNKKGSENRPLFG